MTPGRVLQDAGRRTQEWWVMHWSMDGGQVTDACPQGEAWFFGVRGGGR